MRALLDEDQTEEKISSSDSSHGAFSNYHLRAPTLNKDEHKKKLFDNLLGFPIDSQLDLKLVKGVSG